MRMEKLMVAVAAVGLMLLVGPAWAYKVQVTDVELPNQDGPNNLPRLYDDGGDFVFPRGEQIESTWEYTDLTACTGEPYDDPGIPNVLVTITDIDYGRPAPLRPLWYVADPETAITNFDELVNGSLAFKIDNVGMNTPLIFESLIPNNNFDPGETWQFILQDFLNLPGGPPAPFDSLGISAASTGWPPSTGSIIPEPASLSLLALGGLVALKRKRQP
jgi:hypothetical protein